MSGISTHGVRSRVLARRGLSALVFLVAVVVCDDPPDDSDDLPC